MLTALERTIPRQRRLRSGLPETLQYATHLPRTAQPPPNALPLHRSSQHRRRRQPLVGTVPTPFLLHPLPRRPPTRPQPPVSDAWRGAQPRLGQIPFPHRGRRKRWRRERRHRPLPSHLRHGDVVRRHKRRDRACRAPNTRRFAPRVVAHLVFTANGRRPPRRRRPQHRERPGQRGANAAGPSTLLRRHHPSVPPVQHRHRGGHVRHVEHGGRDGLGHGHRAGDGRPGVGGAGRNDVERAR